MIVLAALIALSGVPIDTAEARRVAAQTPAAHPPAEAPKPRAAAPAPAATAHAAEAAQQPPVPVESAGQGHATPAAQPTADGHAAPAAGAAAAAHGQPPAHAPPAEGGHGAAGAQAGGHAGQAAGHKDEGITPTLYRLFNFAVLAGGLFYFLRTPIAQYLSTRSQQIRGGLVSARETSERATAQLAELDRRLQSLPGELEALRLKGVQEIAAEERHIQAEAEAERTRLLADMERDVDLRMRVAKKQLTEHAADLAVTLAADRARQAITDADQARLIDRYASQVKDING